MAKKKKNSKTKKKKIVGIGKKAKKTLRSKTVGVGKKSGKPTKNKSSAKKTLMPTPKTKKSLEKQPTRRVQSSGKDILLEPLRDRIVVRFVELSETTPGGLYIPQTVLERPLKGAVLAVGTGLLNRKGKIRPLDVKVGDTILFSKYSGTELEFNGEKCLILRESDVLGVVT